MRNYTLHKTHLPDADKRVIGKALPILSIGPLHSQCIFKSPYIVDTVY